MSQREVLIAELEAMGFRRVATRSEKYVALTKDHCAYYFVGRAGALRKGRSISDSYAQPVAKSMLLKRAAARMAGNA